MSEFFIWVFGVQFTLVFGSYVFSWSIYRIIQNKIDGLIKNHVKHLEDRIAELEREMEDL